MGKPEETFESGNTKPATVLFSEQGEQWRPTPGWVECLLHIGHQWPQESNRSRRIAVVSMPGDSAAAGLIALGTMLRDLADPRANELDGHADRLVAYARTYLHNCHRCPLDECDPSIRACGLVKKMSGVFRSTKPHFHLVKFKITRLNNDSKFPVWILADRKRGGGNDCPPLDDLRTFYIDGETPVEISEAGRSLDSAPFSALIPNLCIQSENLRRSYSGVVLASRVAGANQTRAMCQSIQFGTREFERDLADLLTIGGWSSAEVSRVALFNSLTGSFDRKITTPRVVVADGDAAFLKALSNAEFQESDIIGVVHRAIDRDRLEELGNRLTQLSQWYAPDADLLYMLPAVPPGISISILKRRY